jgi:hypothetical protein
MEVRKQFSFYKAKKSTQLSGAYSSNRVIDGRGGHFYHICARPEPQNESMGSSYRAVRKRGKDT